MVKITYAGEGIDKVAIIQFKNFDEIQNMYEVISMVVGSSTCSEGYECDLDLDDEFAERRGYDDNILSSAFANSMSLAKTIFKKPIIYLAESDDCGSYDSITEEIDLLCQYYVKWLKDKDSLEFTKIARQYINNFKKIKNEQ